MSPSFEVPTPDAFAPGTIGPPGRRAFYLQVRDSDLVVTLKCEKQQVAALAEYLDGLLGDLEPAPLGVAVGALELDEPVHAMWTVGTIGVAYDEPADRIVVVLEELVDEETDEDADEDAGPDDHADVDAAGSVRVHLTRAQVAAFVDRSRQLVAAGRPACRFCGFPLDPDGHACPRMN